MIRNKIGADNWQYDKDTIMLHNVWGWILAYRDAGLNTPLVMKTINCHSVRSLRKYVRDPAIIRFYDVIKTFEVENHNLY